jgi:hypothetical protein
MLDSATIRLLTASLDRGEAEAIGLAIEMSADWILMDETDGRSSASRAGLQVTGVIGILLRAKQRGELSLLKPELEALRTQARFFIGGRLEREVLGLAGEQAELTVPPRRPRLISALERPQAFVRLLNHCVLVFHDCEQVGRQARLKGTS